MWVESVVCGSFADNVGLFANNVGRDTPLFANNVGRKMPCLRVGVFLFAGRYTLWRDLQIATRLCPQPKTKTWALSVVTTEAGRINPSVGVELEPNRVHAGTG
ncbi:MAG: hypothetical protein LDL41_03990 [Coleofasciculus sp. S288]|nr:hypothetical protein [Coleofasciculus sp. S288]